jgi:hypothetical protein
MGQVPREQPLNRIGVRGYSGATQERSCQGHVGAASHAYVLGGSLDSMELEHCAIERGSPWAWRRALELFFF